MFIERSTLVIVFLRNGSNLLMATNEVRDEKERDSTESVPAGEGTLGFDYTTLQGEGRH